jgi:hypothetical protein
MGVIEHVQGLLDTTVELEPWTAQDSYGRGTYGAKRTVLARIQQGIYQTLGANGQTLVAGYKVILGEAIQVDPRDRLTLPEAFGPRAIGGKTAEVQPPIRSVQPVYYHGAHDYTVILCG